MIYLIFMHDKLNRCLHRMTHLCRSSPESLNASFFFFFFILQGLRRDFCMRCSLRRVFLGFWCFDASCEGLTTAAFWRYLCVCVTAWEKCERDCACWCSYMFIKSCFFFLKASRFICSCRRWCLAVESTEGSSTWERLMFLYDRWWFSSHHGTQILRYRKTCQQQYSLILSLEIRLPPSDTHQ